MSASDAVIVLLADGLVAVGRVLRGLRRPSGAEVRARQVGEADRLAEVEAAEEVWAPHDPYLNCCTFHEPAYFDDGADELWAAAEAGHGNTAEPAENGLVYAYDSDSFPAGVLAAANIVGSEAQSAWRQYLGSTLPNPVVSSIDVCRLLDRVTQEIRDHAAEYSAPQRSAAVSPPAADNTTDCDCDHDCGCARLLRNPETLKRLLGAVDEDEAVEVLLEEDTSAVDGTQLTDSLEAAWSYHQPSPGWGFRAMGDGVVWACEGCDWSGPTEQAHYRHRFQVLADMKAATHRVQEQLGGTA